MFYICKIHQLVCETETDSDADSDAQGVIAGSHFPPPILQAPWPYVQLLHA